MALFRRSLSILGVLTLLLLGLFAGAPGAQAAPRVDFSCGGSTTSTTPVVCLPGGFREDVHAPLARGETVTFGALVDARGSDVADATVVITLPPSLLVQGPHAVRRLDLPFDPDGEDFEGSRLPCDRAPDATTLSCHLGPLARHHHSVVLVDLTVADDAPIGSSATFGVALQPTDPDTYPSTAVSATIDVIGASHLNAAITPDDVSAVVGHTVTLRVTVRNSGDYPARDTFGFGFVEPQGRSPHFRPHFKITNAPDFFSSGGISIVTIGGSSGESGSGTSAAGQLRAAQTEMTTARVARSVSAQPAAKSARSGATPPARSGSGITISADTDGSVGFWPLGSIAPGQTKAVSVEFRAVSAGRDRFFFMADSFSDQTFCQSLDCDANATATLRAVAATPAPTAAPKPAGHGMRLAATGSATVGPALYLALLALLSGTVLTAAARPNRAFGRHRR